MFDMSQGLTLCGRGTSSSGRASDSHSEGTGIDARVLQSLSLILKNLTYQIYKGIFTLTFLKPSGLENLIVRTLQIRKIGEKVKRAVEGGKMVCTAHLFKF